MKTWPARKRVSLQSIARAKKRRHGSKHCDRNSRPRFEPLTDQWAFLASVPRIEPGTAEAIAREASRTGWVVGVRFADVPDDDEAAAPWMQSSFGRPPVKPITEPLPPVVRMVLAQRLFIEKAGLPSVLLNQLKCLAAFQNPEFYKKAKAAPVHLTDTPGDRLR